MPEVRHEFFAESETLDVGERDKVVTEQTLTAQPNLNPGHLLLWGQHFALVTAFQVALDLSSVVAPAMELLVGWAWQAEIERSHHITGLEATVEDPESIGHAFACAGFQATGKQVHHHGFEPHLAFGRWNPTCRAQVNCDFEFDKASGAEGRDQGVDVSRCGVMDRQAPTVVFSGPYWLAVQGSKTRPEAYHTAAKLLQLEPAEILMVACHNFDLNAALACGYKTAFVKRPTEWGPEGPPDPVPNPAHTYVVDNFPELAARLGA